jgi:hypothetical protein
LRGFLWVDVMYIIRYLFFPVGVQIAELFSVIEEGRITLPVTFLALPFTSFDVSQLPSLSDSVVLRSSFFTLARIDERIVQGDRGGLYYSPATFLNSSNSFLCFYPALTLFF